jgi:hypothetical protein
VSTSVRWCSHNDDWLAEDTVNGYGMPEGLFVLTDSDVAEFNNRVWFKSSVLDIFSEDGKVTNDLSGVVYFLVSRSFFFNEDFDRLTVKITVSNSCCISSISGLHSSKEGWNILNILLVHDLENLSLFINIVFTSS